MSDADPPDEINWSALHEASLNLAEVLWSYNRALIAAGFSEHNALALTIAYQDNWLRGIRE